MLIIGHKPIRITYNVFLDSFLYAKNGLYMATMVKIKKLVDAIFSYII